MKTDADGDTITYSYSWTVGTTTVSGQTGSTLTGSHFDKDDTVKCTVTPSDGADGAPKTSMGVTIKNSAPALSQVTITPSSATVDDTLTCSYSGFSDADGDTDQSTYSWTIGGTMLGTSSTLSGVFSSGDTVVCTVTPFDGDLSGNPLTDSIAADNTPPVLSSATVSPTDPKEGDTVSNRHATRLAGSS